MKPYRWTHAISPYKPYTADYPANTAYCAAQGYETIGGGSFAPGHYPRAAYFVVCHTTGKAPTIAWGTREAVFVTDLAVLLGLSDPYVFADN